MSKILENIEKIKDNIVESCAKAKRDSSEVKLLVVTKAANIEQVKKVVEYGCTELGENKVQHLKVVADEIAAQQQQDPDGSTADKKINWHMIGHLQRNKVRQLLRYSSFIHSVDTLRLAEEISKTASRLGLCPKILMEVNCSLEPQKYGVPVGAAIHLAEQIATMPNIKLAGLMTMAPLTLNEDTVRAAFSRAQELFEEIKSERIHRKDFTELSMGMSQDYKIAIEYGATILRIGSAIFT